MADYLYSRRYSVVSVSFVTAYLSSQSQTKRLLLLEINLRHVNVPNEKNFEKLFKQNSRGKLSIDRNVLQENQWRSTG